MLQTWQASPHPLLTLTKYRFNFVSRVAVKQVVKQGFREFVSSGSREGNQWRSRANHQHNFAGQGRSGVKPFQPNHQSSISIVFLRHRRNIINALIYPAIQIAAPERPTAVHIPKPLPKTVKPNPQ